MIPLYRDSRFTFRFADDRSIPRFHLEGIATGQRVAIFHLDPDTGEALGRIASVTVGADGWVDLAQPILVRAGQGFVVEILNESL